jgi:hypothetical protein
MGYTSLAASDQQSPPSEDRIISEFLDLVTEKIIFELDLLEGTNVMKFERAFWPRSEGTIQMSSTTSRTEF